MASTEAGRSSRSGPNPNLVDVAQRAGVSRGTVSNVLNYPDRVVAATRERVQAAIDELGYVRNDAARSLAVGRSTSLGFVLPNIENSLFVDMSYGAQQVARESKLSLLLGNSADDDSQQDAYLDQFDEARVAGVLLAAMEDSSAGIRRMRSHGRQIVLLNYDPRDHDCCAVLADNQIAGFLAARHLIELGCERLAFLAGHDDWQPVRERRRGVERAVAEENGRVSLEHIAAPGLFHDHGALLGEDFLRRAPGDRPDGVIAVTDNLAYGFVETVVRGGVTLPDGVAVVGCENNRGAVRATIPVTTVGTDGIAMGAAAARLLLEEITAEPGRHQHRTEMFEPVLVARESTVGRSLP